MHSIKTLLICWEPISTKYGAFTVTQIWLIYSLLPRSCTPSPFLGNVMPWLPPPWAYSRRISCNSALHWPPNIEGLLTCRISLWLLDKPFQNFLCRSLICLQHLSSDSLQENATNKLVNQLTFVWHSEISKHLPELYWNKVFQSNLKMQWLTCILF